MFVVTEDNNFLKRRRRRKRLIYKVTYCTLNISFCSVELRSLSSTLTMEMHSHWGKFLDDPRML